MVKLPGGFEADVSAIPDKHAGYVRTGAETAVPTRILASALIPEPAIEISMFIQVDGGGRARVRQFEVVAGDLNTAVTTSLLRRLPVDALVREALNSATRTVRPRPDVNPHAFQVPGDPDNQAWVSRAPARTQRGKKVPEDRVARAARVYLRALREGSNAPAEVVAKELGYSRATAARDIRAARERNPPLLPPPGSQLAVDPAAGEEFPAPGATGRISWMPRDEYVRRAEELGLRGTGAAEAPAEDAVKHPGVPLDEGAE